MKEIMVEDISKRFEQMCNYSTKHGLNEMTYLSNLEMGENDGGQNIPPADGSGDPNAIPPQGGSDMGGGAPPMDGGDTNTMPPQGGADMGGGAPQMDADPNAVPADGGAQPPEGFNPQDTTMGGDMQPSDMEQPGDEVLDVTELTDKQDEVEKEIEQIGGKFDKVMKALGAFEELLRSNDEKIEDLKAEFEKRNPTQIEKLSMQTAKSYPFNVTPEEFWKEKEATSNYSTEDDDNGKEQGQYVITANDVNGDVDWKSISDSLDDDDFMYNQTLNKVLGMI